MPADALILVPGGPEVGAALTADVRDRRASPSPDRPRPRKRIARALLEDDERPIVPLIAETGGINAMIVDSTALPEQVVADVVASAFRSAGQRCSALRLLLVQEEIADGVIEMLAGAMDTLIVGDPGRSGDRCRAGDRPGGLRPADGLSRRARGDRWIKTVDVPADGPVRAADADPARRHRRR